MAIAENGIKLLVEVQKRSSVYHKLITLITSLTTRPIQK